ncbi:hypothetical protein ILYODFUR_010032 [Ilyodon furcidens]|uniref:Uncharacterized protein n=1 Tax=Ilyodon furcidens TaxID=33524 RepID=A0ABV0SVQ0_9TELE
MITLEEMQRSTAPILKYRASSACTVTPNLTSFALSAQLKAEKETGNNPKGRLGSRLVPLCTSENFPHLPIKSNASGS